MRAVVSSRRPRKSSPSLAPPSALLAGSLGSSPVASGEGDSPLSGEKFVGVAFANRRPAVANPPEGAHRRREKAERSKRRGDGIGGGVGGPDGGGAEGGGRGGDPRWRAGEGMGHPIPQGPILNSASVQHFEDELQTTHLPEMVFGESFLSLQHIQTGIKLHFNALDAIKGWKKEALPPVEVPAAANWKFRSNPSDQVKLDYDYTFTTPYCGSDTVVLNPGTMQPSLDGCSTLCWEDTNDRIDLVALSAKEPILFYDEVILYEDELADSGISFLTVRVRVMPTGWFLLLRFWLRVDGMLMRLRDTRLHCSFGNGGATKPLVLRECCWREATFASLSAKGYPSDSAAYADPNLIAQKLPVVMQKTQKLKIPN